MDGILGEYVPTIHNLYVCVCVWARVCVCVFFSSTFLFRGISVCFTVCLYAYLLVISLDDACVFVPIRTQRAEYCVFIFLLVLLQ